MKTFMWKRPGSPALVASRARVPGLARSRSTAGAMRSIQSRSNTWRTQMAPSSLNRTMSCWVTGRKGCLFMAFSPRIFAWSGRFQKSCARGPSRATAEPAMSALWTLRAVGTRPGISARLGDQGLDGHRESDVARIAETPGRIQRIAASLRHSAQRSRRRKADPYRSALSMLTFYINRAGKNLSAAQRKTLQRAKGELRRQFGITTKPR